MTQITSSKKIVAGLLSFAMVFSLVVSLGVVSASAQTAMTTTTTTSSWSYTFTRNLTVGSRGADVTALQTMLQAKGFLSVAPTGYFGGLTKAALAGWQASVGISPAVGYFGPLTRGYVATMSTTTTTTSTVPGCMAGAMYSSTTGAPCTTTTPGSTSTTWSADGTDGSLTVSSSAFVSSGTQVRKGQTGGLVAVQLQATAGKVNVSRFDVHMNVRPWLYFGQLQLKDANGNVLATKNLSSAADATEVTVGTDYLVRFDNVNYVVTPGSTKTLAVYGMVLSTTDKLSSNVSVTSWVPTDSIRTINGKNFTDSVGLGASSTGNSITLLGGTSSNGDIAVRISPSTPAQRIVATNSTSATNDVVLGMFDVKSQNSASTINSLTFTVQNSTGSSTNITSVLSNLRLLVGGQTYGAAAFATTSSVFPSQVSFTNLNINLPQDAWTTMTLEGNVAAGVNNIVASSTIAAATISGVDTNFNNLTVSGSNQTSNDVSLLAAGLTLSAPSATTDGDISGIISGSTAGKVGVNTKYTLTLTNNGNNDVYVARAAGAFVGTTTSYNGVLTANTASSSITTLQVADTQAGDNVNANAYVVAAGSSRTFTLKGVLKAPAGGGTAEQRITAIYFNTSASAVTSTSTASVINFGLNSLVINTGL